MASGVGATLAANPRKRAPPLHPHSKEHLESLKWQPDTDGARAVEGEYLYYRWDKRPDAPSLYSRMLIKPKWRDPRPQNWEWLEPTLAANPSLRARGESINRIVQKAGWSYGLAQDQLKSDGIARWHNRLLYVLTDDSDDTVPSDPREPVFVGVYALNETEGEWVDVGSKEFPDLRSALQGWQRIEVDVDTVQSLSGGSFANNDSYSPFHERLPGGRAAGMRPEDFDPVELARGTKHELEHTGNREIATEIAMDHLAEDEGYYVKLDAMERGSFRDNPKLQWQPEGWARLAPGQFYRLRQRARGEWLVVLDGPKGENVVGAERTPALAKRLAQEHSNRQDNPLAYSDAHDAWCDTETGVCGANAPGRRDNPCGCEVG